MQSNLYLIGNIFEDDFHQRKIKTNPELIFKELERLRIENNLLHEKSDVIKMVADLTTTIKEDTQYIVSRYKTPKKPVAAKAKKKLTNEEKVADLVHRITTRKR